MTKTDVTLTALLGAALFTPLVVLPQFYFPHVTASTYLFYFLVQLAAMVWLCRAFVSKKAVTASGSPTLAAVIGLIAMLFISNIFGVEPVQSFFSNFSRMDGWIMLVHILVFIFLAGEQLKEKTLLIKLSIIVAVITSVLALIYQDGVFGGRTAGALGNPIYLGMYMVLSTFLAGLLTVRNRAWYWLLPIPLFVTVLLTTQSRGAALGLMVGSITTFAILALKNKGHLRFFVAPLVVIIGFSGGLWLLKDTAFVKSVPAFERITSISLDQDGSRLTLWKVAFEAWKERPILGWGQENFLYAYTQYYDPILDTADPWYDRAHSTIFEYLVAGGLFGLVTYLLVFCVAIYSAWRLPEAAIIIGFMVAHGVQSAFNFDTLGTYIMLGLVLGYIHIRGPSKLFTFPKWPLLLVVPIVLLASYVSLQGWLAAQDLYTARTERSLPHYELALQRNYGPHRS